MHGSFNDCQNALCTGWNHCRKTPLISVGNRHGSAVALFSPTRFQGNKMHPERRKMFLKEMRIRYEHHTHFQKPDRVKKRTANPLTHPTLLIGSPKFGLSQGEFPNIARHRAF